MSSTRGTPICTLALPRTPCLLAALPMRRLALWGKLGSCVFDHEFWCMVARSRLMVLLLIWRTASKSPEIGLGIDTLRTAID